MSCKTIVYKGSDGSHYAFRSCGGDGSLASAMGEVIFEKEADDPNTATVLARIEAKKRGITVKDL